MDQPLPDPFGHGKQVGVYTGLLQAIQVLQNALSAGDLEDDKL